MPPTLSRLIRAGLSIIVLVQFSQVALAAELAPFRASPDQVLVLYNADWKKDSPGSAPGQDSKEVAEYYAAMHTDPVTGKKPHILGLTCRHLIKGDHLNHWFVKEESNDNTNGVIYKGKGSAPEGDWIRDSRRVEIRVNDPEVDWDSVVVTCRSKIADREVTLSRRQETARTGDDGALYSLNRTEKGGTIAFDASRIFSGPVTVGLKLKNKAGKTIRDLSLRYYDLADFAFTPTGPDGVADDKILEEDVLTPVRKFIEDKANALPDGTLLKDHILYIVVVHGMPWSAKAVFGIEHGATSSKGDHGSLASLEQRLQTLYYGWDSFRPPVISFMMGGGPDSNKGVVNHIITTAMRHPLMDRQWNPYMHPDTYSFLRKSKKEPFFYDLAPLGQRRKALPREFFIYAVTRIDGADAEEAKRVIDYSLYASKYLRPEMDCRVRETLDAEGRKTISDLAERLKKAENQNLWERKEIEALGFRAGSAYDHGLPFMARPVDDLSGRCGDGKSSWETTGFYPGGVGMHIISHNGWNMSSGPIWRYTKQGVTVSACGAPAYGGGPHITNATFFDSRILFRYLFRGRDLGECLLISTIYTNWSTSLLGDPLMHPDLRETVIDRTPPALKDTVDVKFEPGAASVTANMHADLAHDPAAPEVAVLQAVFRDGKGNELRGVSPLYSRRPHAVVQGLAPDMEYTVKIALIDPYGNRTELPERVMKTEAAQYLGPMIRKLWDGLSR